MDLPDSDQSRPGSGSRLQATVDALRSALAQSTNLFSFLLGGTVDEQTAAAEGVPQEFLDFCRVLAREHQFYRTPVVDSPRCPCPRRHCSASG